MAPVDLYIRVSRVGGRENLISPDEQERRGRSLAAERGLVVGEVIVDLDESGGKWERPGLQRALGRVESGETGGVIVAWLDRLSRDSEHSHALVRRITDAGGQIYAPDAPTDWTTPEGGLQAGILFEFNAYVRKRARARFESAKEQAIARGIPVNNRAATGYLKGADRKLEKDPDTAFAVTQAFEARVHGAGPVEIAQILEAAGVRTSQGSRVWSREAVYQMLRNRVYLGELSYGKDKRFVNVAAHEPLVDLATWQLAQRAVTARGMSPRVWLMSGLLRCEGCRHALQGTMDSHRHPTYKCKRRHAGGICPKPVRSRAERVETAVLADMWDNLPPLKVTGEKDAGGRLAALAKTAEHERAALGDWASPQVQAEIGDLDLYVTGMRERRERAAQAEAALVAEQRLRAMAQAFPGATTWRALWDGMDIAERAGMLARLYDCIELRRNPDLLIFYPAGSGPADMPRRGYRRDIVLRGFEVNRPDDARVAAF